MKIFIFLLSMMYLQGCTYAVVKLAEGVDPFEQPCPEEDKNHPQDEPKPNPWWYAAIPLTVPLDIIGMPLLFGLFPMALSGGHEKEKHRQCVRTYQLKQ